MRQAEMIAMGVSMQALLVGLSLAANGNA